jgi:hypothetical protein
MARAIITRIPHPLREPASLEEARTEHLYKKLRETFDGLTLSKWARRALGRGVPIGVIYRSHEWWCDVSPRLEHENDKYFRERDIMIDAVGFLNKELKGLVDLITRFDVELAHKEAELMEKDAALADKSELYDSLVAMLDTLTRGRKFTEQQFEILSRIIVEQSIRAKIDALEARLAEFEATQSRERLKPLELPPPQPESKRDGERQDSA